MYMSVYGTGARPALLPWTCLMECTTSAKAQIFWLLLFSNFF
jgi:hypothetical protein